MRSSKRGPQAAFRRILHDPCGGAVGEYAIILAMVIGLALMATRFLGESSRDAFARVFDARGANAPARSRDHSPTARSIAADADEPARQFSWLDARLLAAELVALAALGGLLYVSHKVRKRRELIGDDNEVPAALCNTAVQNRLFEKRQQIYKLLSNDMDTVLASRMDVSHVMSRNLTVVAPNMPAGELRALMRSKKLRHLLVCDKSGSLIGILSDRDFTDREGAMAAELMTPDPFTVAPDSLISPAITLMIDRHISCLPVVDECGGPIAVLTSTDLMMALQCSLQILHKLAIEIGSPESRAAESESRINVTGEAAHSDGALVATVSSNSI